MVKKSMILLMTLLFGTVLFAQNDGAESQLKKIFDLCKDKNYSEASSYILYQGDDLNRNLKTTYNYKDRKEKMAVDRICKKIFALLDISDKYEIKSKSTEDKNGLSWTVIKVGFLSGAQEIEGSFYLAKVKDKYLLGSID